MVDVKHKTKPAIELDLDEVERLAEQGLTDQQIADCLGISRRTLANRKKDSAQIAQAIKRGKAKGIAKVTNALFDKITQEKNTTAIIFFLKSQAGWRETQVIEQNVNVQSMDEVYKRLDEILESGQERDRIAAQKAEMLARREQLDEEQGEE